MPVCAQCGTDNPEIAKFCLACGSALAAAPPRQEFRKIVTIVFSDLKGSTAMGEKLDSESLREVMTRYFDSMSAELERHGGVVEKFIGDAIMAVFGLPKLHEDDALRAVRAAADMQRAQAKLNDELERHWGVRLTVRTGVNTGEVVAGDPTSGQRLVTGDAVNVAARLEQAAGAQEVLLGDLTYRLVRDYVDVQEVEPLDLKGKSKPVPAYRLVGIKQSSERQRRLDSPMIGRDRELEQLSGALEGAIDTRTCRLVTIVGEAGVGKSRLIDEFVLSVEDRVQMLRGRCLPYGDGITFWPLAEAVRQAAGIVERDTMESAKSKVAGLTSDSDVLERVESLIGLSSTLFPVEELVWGARKLLEELARVRPLVVLFEDIHWAEATFLEFLEQIVSGTEDAQLLIVGSARHELVERLPEWSTGGHSAMIELERLSADEAGAIAEHLLGATGLDARIRSRIATAAEGNPLFVEQFLSMLIDDGLIRFEGGSWRATTEIDRVNVPPTIQALLASRIDHLEPDERAVIEPASVIGYLFVKDAVRHLVQEHIRDDIEAKLGVLTGKQLVQPDPTRPSDEEAFRFHHILIRDTAYEGVLKRARARYHEHFVEWADGVNREGATEFEEILGYHLEQAHRYRSELGPLDDKGQALGADGSRRLASAGRRAFSRGDVAAAAKLLGRAVALLRDDEPAKLELLPDYGEALLQVGRFSESETVLDMAIERAPAAGLPGVRAHALLVRLLVKLRAGDPESWRDEAAATITEAMAVFQEAGDDAGLAKAWRLLAWSHGVACHFGLAAEASEKARAHATLAGDVRQQTRSSVAYAAGALFGPTPVPEAIERCSLMAEGVSGDRQSEAILLALLASLLAMYGSFERAREHAGQSRAMLEELGLDVELASIAIEAWRVEMLAGEALTAEHELRRAYELLTGMGEKYLLSTVSGLLGQTVYDLGRLDEAEDLGRQSRDLSSDDDVGNQALWRCLLAKVLARQGKPDQAEAYVREALEILAPTDHVLLKYGALLDTAEVLRLAGRDAENELIEARRLARAKGSPTMTKAVEALLLPTPETLVS